MAGRQASLAGDPLERLGEPLLGDARGIRLGLRRPPPHGERAARPAPRCGLNPSAVTQCCGSSMARVWQRRTPLRPDPRAGRAGRPAVSVVRAAARSSTARRWRGGRGRAAGSSCSPMKAGVQQHDEAVGSAGGHPAATTRVDERRGPAVVGLPRHARVRAPRPSRPRGRRLDVQPLARSSCPGRGVQKPTTKPATSIAGGRSRISSDRPVRRHAQHGRHEVVLTGEVVEQHRSLVPTAAASGRRLSPMQPVLEGESVAASASVARRAGSRRHLGSSPSTSQLVL